MVDKLSVMYTNSLVGWDQIVFQLDAMYYMDIWDTKILKSTKANNDHRYIHVWYIPLGSRTLDVSPSIQVHIFMKILVIGLLFLSKLGYILK
jgi:hypothetical protein